MQRLVANADAWSECMRYLGLERQLSCRAACRSMRRGTDDFADRRHALLHPGVPIRMAHYVDLQSRRNQEALRRAGDALLRLRVVTAAYRSATEIAIASPSLQFIALQVTRHVVSSLQDDAAAVVSWGGGGDTGGAALLEPPPNAMWHTGWLLEDDDDAESQQQQQQQQQ